LLRPELSVEKRRKEKKKKTVKRKRVTVKWLWKPPLQKKKEK